MRTIFFVCAMLGLAFLSPAPVAAQSAAPDARRMELARELVDSAHVLDAVTQVIADLAPLMADAVRVNQPDWSGVQVDQYVDLFLEEFAALREQLREETAAEYARRFTQEELAAFVAFYTSGPGRRLVEEQSALQTALGNVGERIGRVAGINALERMQRGERSSRPAAPDKT